jgi:hypothetical protein
MDILEALDSSQYPRKGNFTSTQPQIYEHPQANTKKGGILSVVDMIEVDKRLAGGKR